MLDGKKYERAKRALDLLSNVLERIIPMQIAVSRGAPFQNIVAKYDEALEDDVDRYTIRIANSQVEYTHSEFSKA